MATPPESALYSTPETCESPPASRQAPGIEASDGELLRLFAREPSEEAFRRLIDRHGDMVWGVCRRVLANRHDAEDAYQATFLLLARRARMVRASESAAGWLYRVAHRTALSAKQRARRRREAELEEEPTVAEAQWPDLAGRETAAALMEELGRMPTRYRTPLVLRYLEGRSRREIAGETDSTIAAVQGRLARGKAMLRGRMLRRGVSLSAAVAIATGSASAAEAAPTRLVSQTSAHATTLAAGGSLAASTAVMTLYREGARAMLAGQLSKPAAALAAVLIAATLLAVPGPGEADDANGGDQLALQADAPNDTGQSAPAPAVEIEKPGKIALRSSPVYPVAYYIDDLIEKNPGSAQEIIERIRQSVVPEQWGGETDYAIKFFEDRKSLIVAVPEAVHEEVAAKISAIRDEAYLSGPPVRFDSGDQLNIAVAGALTDEPINGAFTVERGGTVALGPVYGRVRVAGMTIREAERAVRKHLQKTLKDPLVQVTEVANPASTLAASGAVGESEQPTPENGTVAEYWPNGEYKSERTYRDGRLVVATEFAENGTLLYEYSDEGPRGPRESEPEQQPEAPEEEVPIAEIKRLMQLAEASFDAADKITRETTVPSRGRRIAQTTFSNHATRFLRQAEQITEQYLSVESTEGTSTDELIRLIDQRSSQVTPLLTEISAMSNRQQKSMELWNDRMRELAEAKRSAAAAQEQEREAEPVASAARPTPEPEPTEETAKPEDKVEELRRAFEERMARAERDLKRAEALVEQHLVMRRQAVAADPLSREPPSGHVYKRVGQLAEQNARTAKNYLSQASQFLTNYMDQQMLAAVDGELEQIDDATQDTAEVLNPLFKRCETYEDRALLVVKKLQLVERSFRPDPAVTGSEWTVHDTPSPFNPNGWAVEARLAPGGTAPIGPKDADGERHQLVFVKEPEMARGMLSFPLLLAIRNEHGEQVGSLKLQHQKLFERGNTFSIGGQKIEVIVRREFVSRSESATSPFLPIVIRPAPSEAGMQSIGGLDAGAGGSEPRGAAPLTGLAPAE